MGKSVKDLIVEAMREIGAIGKDSLNKSQGFRYRGIDQVMNAAHPVFAKVGLFILPEVLERECSEVKTAKGTSMYHHKLTVRWTFYGAGCSDSLSMSTVGEAMDAGDKGSAKCMAISLKYALFSSLMIPLEASEDPDAHSPLQDEKPVQVSKPKPRATVTWAEDPKEGKGSLPANETYPTQEDFDRLNQLAKQANFSVRDVVDYCHVNFDAKPREITAKQALELEAMLQAMIQVGAP